MFGVSYYFIHDLASDPYRPIFDQQKLKLEKLNQRVLQTRQDHSKPDPVSDLADRLVKGVNDDLEKTYILYKWITENISYDTATLREKMQRFSTPSPQRVISSLKAQCDGYAQLFYTMAKRAGLNAEIITGIAGDIRSSDGHAWNAIKLNGTWYMLDATWDAGAVTSDYRFIKNTNRYSYFLSKPEEFYKTHTIGDPKWKFSFSGTPQKIKAYVEESLQKLTNLVLGRNIILSKNASQITSILVISIFGFLMSFSMLTIIRYK